MDSEEFDRLCSLGASCIGPDPPDPTKRKREGEDYTLSQLNNEEEEAALLANQQAYELSELQKQLQILTRDKEINDQKRRRIADEKKNLMKKNKAIEKELEETKKALENCDICDIPNFTTKLMRNKDDLEQAKRDKDKCDSELEECNQNMRRLEEEIKALKQEKETLIKDKEEYWSDVSKLDGENSTLKLEIENLRSSGPQAYAVSAAKAKERLPESTSGSAEIKPPQEASSDGSGSESDTSSSSSNFNHWLK